MIASIDFSIFASPSKAYGNITGKIEILLPPEVGGEVEIFYLNSSIKLKIISINYFEENPPVFLGLDDIVLNSLEEAAALVKRLEENKNLFFDEY